MDIEFAADMASASAAGAESFILNQLAYVRMLQTPPIPQECLDRRSQLEAIKAELQELLAEVESNANPAIAAQQMQRFIDSNERFQTAVLNYKTTDCDLSLVLDVIDDYRRLHNQINWLLHDGENRQDPIDMPNETYL